MSALKHPFQRPERESSETQRLEAFSDGVFAIAITLLILDIHTPQTALHETSAHLGRALLGLWPTYAVYVLSFVNIGIYWANHHHIFQLYKRTNHVFNLLNVFFLMCISFVPLPTSVLGEYLTNPVENKAAVCFYALGLFFPAFSWLMIWLYARSAGLLDERLAPRYVKKMTLQFVLSLVPYTIAILIAFLNPWLSFALSIGITFCYLLPPKKVVYRQETLADGETEPEKK